MLSLHKHGEFAIDQGILREFAGNSSCKHLPAGLATLPKRTTDSLDSPHYRATTRMTEDKKVFILRLYSPKSEDPKTVTIASGRDAIRLLVWLKSDHVPEGEKALYSTR